MTPEQRAQQFWSVLVFAAKEQKLVSYFMLEQMTGFYESPGPVLQYVYRYCKQHHLPPLNAIVIDQTTGLPGEECPFVLDHLPAQQARVFLYDWFDHPAPSDEMFKNAVAMSEVELERAEAEYEALPC